MILWQVSGTDSFWYGLGLVAFWTHMAPRVQFGEHEYEDVWPPPPSKDLNSQRQLGVSGDAELSTCRTSA